MMRPIEFGSTVDRPSAERIAGRAVGGKEPKRQTLSARERRQLIIWGSGAVITLSSLFYLMSRFMASVR